MAVESAVVSSEDVGGAVGTLWTGGVSVGLESISGAVLVILRNVSSLENQSYRY